MEEPSTHDILYPPDPPRRPRRNRKRYKINGGPENSEQPSSEVLQSQETVKVSGRSVRSPGSKRERPGGNVVSASGSGVAAESSGSDPSSGASTSKNRTPPKQTDATNSNSASAANRPSFRTNRRGTRFNANLTNSASSTNPSSSVQPASKYSLSVPRENDLTSSLIRALGTPPYTECLICCNAIHPAQPTWSCSPWSASGAKQENVNVQCCWTTFHLKCIKFWAAKSVKEIVDAWRARGEDRGGEWRCPACQLKRETVPSGYRCFCGSMPEPKPPRLSTPHSCANPCSCPRTCAHPCPLSCHPGPCPPCQITTRLPCHCGHQTMSLKCSHLTPGKAGLSAADLSCGKICGRRLGCGNHSCGRVCHEGDCGACEIREQGRCYCGKVIREIGCGEGEEQVCVVGSTDERDEEKWLGRFDCGDVCGRSFDCNIHKCLKPCHPPSPTPPPCPRSPSLTTQCPCGKHPISIASAAWFPPDTLLSRKSCSDPIPNCTSTCLKPLEGCSHVCSSKCHAGPCPPCTITTVRPCRCGATTRGVQCSSLQNESSAPTEILCDKPCQVLRACGRHQCNRICCPLASLPVTKGRGKKRQVTEETLLDESGLHVCDLVCGKMLSCGNHRCEETDHRGACPPCLRSSFEEMICHCNRTVLDPPIPCGTLIDCTHPCSRPPPPCGHPSTHHTCHEDPTLCPPCPFLTNKNCACGKKVVGNVKCSQEKVFCGIVCGKLMTCGFHHCERLCHSGDCGTCTAVCGKSRKFCLPSNHPCTLPCHAPSSCPENSPCQSLITLTCPCGRIHQPAKCARSAANPSPSSLKQIKCTSECAIAKRNARLADALGIGSDNREKSRGATFGDDVLGFARVGANAKFVALVEKTFAEFVTSSKKTQVLPHMPMDRRKFVHDLAATYRMDTQMVDQEPHRSVQIIRRIDTRIPSPLLSATVSSLPSGSTSLGKLADMRAPPVLRPGPSRSPAPGSATTGGSWTSVVARSRAATPSSSRLPDQKAPETIQRIPPTSVPLPSAVGPQPPLAGEEVPDNWEDAS